MLKLLVYPKHSTRKKILYFIEVDIQVARITMLKFCIKIYPPKIIKEEKKLSIKLQVN